MNEEAKRYTNGVTAYMLSHITRRTKREEAMHDETTFDIICMLKQTLRVIFDNRHDGDLLMGIQEDDCTRLQMQARGRKE